MNQLIGQFLKTSVEMELSVGEVYQLFSVKFPQDYDFWWKLSIEEMNHAALIESINDVFLDESILPLDSLEKQIIDLGKMIFSVNKRIENYRLVSPTRSEAFNYGLELENSIGEFHFELFMTSVQNSQMVKIFQKLNGDDVNHANRIADYMKINKLI